jgi:hypothetical protein
MNYQIKLADGKLHPVKFGMGALYQYESKDRAKRNRRLHGGCKRGRFAQIVYHY